MCSVNVAIGFFFSNQDRQRRQRRLTTPPGPSLKRYHHFHRPPPTANLTKVPHLLLETLQTCWRVETAFGSHLPLAGLPGRGVWNHQAEEGPELPPAEQGGRRLPDAGRDEGRQQRY